MPGGLGGTLVQVAPPGYSDPHNYSPPGWVPPPAGIPLIAGSGDWRTATSPGAALTSGQLMLSKIPLPGGPVTITNIIYGVSTAGATLTAGQCFAGVYDDQGNLIGASADQSGIWTAAARYTTALAGGPFTIYSPFVYGALLSNGTTNPIFLRSVNAIAGTMLSLGATGAQMAFALNVAAQTSLPATVAYSANTVGALAQSLWMGVS